MCICAPTIALDGVDLWPSTGWAPILRRMASGPRISSELASSELAAAGPPGDGVRARRPRFWPIPVITALALLPMVTWLGAYFWVNSTPGRALVTDWIVGRAPAGRLVIRDVHWGPLPDELRLGDVSVLDENGRPLVHASEVTADVVVSEILAGDLVLDRVRATDYLLALAWDADGRLNLSRALARPERAGSATKRRTTRRLLDLRRIELVRGDVTLEWPRWGLQFSGVSARGAIHVDRGGAAAIHADLQGGRAHALWGGGDRAVHAEAVEITGFDWADHGFGVGRLAVRGDDGSAVDVSGSLELSGDLALAVEGDVVLGAALAQLIGAGAFAEGGRVSGLDLELDGPTMTGRAERVEIPAFTAGPFTARGVTTALDDFTYVPGMLKPTGALVLRDTRVATLSAPGLSVEETAIGRVNVLVRAQSSATLDDVVARAIIIEDRVTLAAKAHVEATFGLTSGDIDASVITDAGRVAATGTIRVSPFSKKLTVALRVAVEQVGGDLAGYLLSWLPADATASLTAPLEGFAVFRTVLGKERVEGEKGKRWVATTTLDEAQLEGGGSVVYDGEAWAATAPPAAPATP